MAKRREKRRTLRVRLTKAWYVEVIDENEDEVENDWCFGTRADAMADGQKMKKALIEGGYLNVPKG